MIKYLTIFFLLFSFVCFGQELTKVDSSKKSELSTPASYVDQMPTFPGGNVAMVQFIHDNLSYPASCSPIQGTVYITFVVEMDGSLSDIKVLRGIPGGSSCDEEALRVVKMMPKWNAGKLNGRTVRVQYNLPIKFSLK